MARPLGEVRPPGVYISHTDVFPRTVPLTDTRTAGFVGLSVKGPLDEPVRIASWDEFVEVFGDGDIGYLARSVEGFFVNGGSRCHVVRVAHRARGETQPGPEHAFAAERVARDGWDKPTLRVRAKSEGRWGNNVWARFAHATGPKALLTQDLEVGSGEALVNTARGFERGALVRIYDRQASDYVVLTEVGERIIRWSSGTPVNRRYRAAGPSYLEVIELELHVALRDRRETFRGLQMHPSSRQNVCRVVAEQSRLVTVEDLGSKSPLPHYLPKAEPAAKLAAGRDGVDAVTPEDFVGFDNGPGDRAGLMALTSVDEVAILACPDAMVFTQRKPGPEGDSATQRIQDQMVILCENLKDRFAVLDCPQTRDVEAVKRWRRRTDSSFCAYYWPWFGIVTADGKVQRIPPSGHMAGMYARVEEQVGVHRAPANEPLRGVVDLSVNVTEDDQGLLNAEGVNTYRSSRGIRPWGARTASSDIDWRFINVRRLFIMLRRSLEEGSRWAVFEPNTANTWDSLESKVSTFLDKLYQKGMFAGGSPQDSFYVKCDAETNPADEVDAGRLVVEVGVAPAVPAEFIVIRVTQKLGEEEQAQAQRT
jgi:phage tail sheath protein FI